MAQGVLAAVEASREHLELILISLSPIRVKLLQDPHRVLHHLLVRRWRVVTEWLDHGPDVQIFESLATLLVHAQVADREQRDASRRLPRTLVTLDHFQQLLQRPMLNQIFAQRI